MHAFRKWIVLTILATIAAAGSTAGEPEELRFQQEQGTRLVVGCRYPTKLDADLSGCSELDIGRPYTRMSDKDVRGIYHESFTYERGKIIIHRPIQIDWAPLAAQLQPSDQPPANGPVYDPEKPPGYVQPGPLCAQYLNHPNVTWGQVSCLNFNPLAQYLPGVIKAGYDTQVLMHVRRGSVVEVTMDKGLPTQVSVLSTILLDAEGRRIALVPISGVQFKTLNLRFFDEF